MNAIHRDTVAHGVIAATVLAGAYMLVVARQHSLLDEANVQADRLGVEVRDAEAMRDKVAEMTAAVREAESRAAIIRERSGLSGNGRALHTALTDLATRHRLRLDELNPSAPSSAPVSVKGPGPGVPAGSAANVEKALAFSMVATASYSDVAKFIQAVQTELGYSVVRSVRVSPVPEEPGVVRATLSTEHYWFDVTPRADAAQGVTQGE